MSTSRSRMRRCLGFISSFLLILGWPLAAISSSRAAWHRDALGVSSRQLCGDAAPQKPPQGRGAALLLTPSCSAGRTPAGFTSHVSECTLTEVFWRAAPGHGQRSSTLPHARPQPLRCSSVTFSNSLMGNCEFTQPLLASSLGSPLQPWRCGMQALLHLKREKQNKTRFPRRYVKAHLGPRQCGSFYSNSASSGLLGRPSWARCLHIWIHLQHLDGTPRKTAIIQRGTETGSSTTFNSGGRQLCEEGPVLVPSAGSSLSPLAAARDL